MRYHTAGLRIVLVAATLTLMPVLGLVMSGCGDKIAIPQPTGIFSLNQYVALDTFTTTGSALQLTQGRGALFILTTDSLSKRDTRFGLIEQVGGLAGPQSLCVDEQGDFVFVWENDAQRVSWFDAGSLDPVGSTILPDVQTAVAMATNPEGIDQVPGAKTYLYISDPLAGVIHRYAFDEAAGLSPFGILARDSGEGARFVLEAAGMATDSEDFLLVCDADTNRNWVLRFASTPDPSDTSLDPDEPDPMRGYAALFDTATCDPPAASDFVIGDAAECQESDWVGGPSSEEGEFHANFDVEVDGLGRIFVADTENSRIQQFTPNGVHEIQFICSEPGHGPTSIGLFDEDGSAPGSIDYGAFLFMTLKGSDTVVKYISYDHYQTIFGELPLEQ
jgi:hypothetical protein